MKSPLHRYLNDMLYALKARAFYSSLALTTPDICGSIDFPSASVGNRYRDWLGAWCGMLHGNRAPGGSLSHSVYEREGSRTLSGQLSAEHVTASGQKPAVSMPVELFCAEGWPRPLTGWWNLRGAAPWWSRLSRGCWKFDRIQRMMTPRRD